MHFFCLSPIFCTLSNPRKWLVQQLKTTACIRTKVSYCLAPSSFSIGERLNTLTMTTSTNLMITSTIMPMRNIPESAITTTAHTGMIRTGWSHTITRKRCQYKWLGVISSWSSKSPYLYHSQHGWSPLPQ